MHLYYNMFRRINCLLRKYYAVLFDFFFLFPFRFFSYFSFYPTCSHTNQPNLIYFLSSKHQNISLSIISSLFLFFFCCYFFYYLFSVSFYISYICWVYFPKIFLFPFIFVPFITVVKIYEIEQFQIKFCHIMFFNV